MTSSTGTRTGSYEVTTEASALPSTLQRISWGAVIGGVVIALVTHLTLSMLGVSLGAATINPLTETNPLDPELGTGTVIWIAATTLISLASGGWVAGRLAGIPDPTDGVVHGLLTWAVVSLLTVFLITTSVGNLISGAARAISQGLSLAGQGVAALAPEAAEAVEQQNVSLESIREEVRGLLNPAGTTQPPVDQPSDATQPTNQATTGTDANITLTAAERQANLLIGRLLRLGTNATEGDRTQVVTFLVEQGGMTQEQAQQTVQRWEQEYQQFAAQAEEVARQVGERAADAIAAIAGVAFISMVVGAFAAGAGGLLGSPTTRVLPTVEMEKETVRRAA